MLLAITDAQSLSEALRVSALGALLVQVALYVAVALGLLCLAGMVWRDERWVVAARRGQYLLFSLIALAAAMLLLMAFQGMFVSSYLARITDSQEDVFFQITSLWASQEGSLLFWCLMLSAVCAIFAFQERHSRTDARMPPTLFVLFAVQAFFLAMLMPAHANPFTTQLDWLADPRFADMGLGEALQRVVSGQGVEGMQNSINWILEAHIDDGRFDQALPSTHFTLGQIHELFLRQPEQLPPKAIQSAIRAFSDGQGYNPQLHNYWIVIHPPVLYAGFVGFTVPFAYAIGALVSGDVGVEWLRRARLWSMASWLLLTCGIAMGGLWAYEILGWGGYWAWDPVENASFIPWLTATAFIHSAVMNERRGQMRAWAFALIILTYCLTILGTFLVRTGAVQSVHAFGDTGMSWPLLAFLVASFVVPLLLLVYRVPLLAPPRPIDSVFSREGVFVLNNFLLCSIAAVVLSMTIWPLMTEYISGASGAQHFGPESFALLVLPLFILMLVLTAVGQLMGYGAMSLGRWLKRIAVPLVLFLLAFIVNGVWLWHADLLRVPEPDMDTATWLVECSRLCVQLLVAPLLVLILASTVSEWLMVTRRRRKPDQAWMAAALGAALVHRRTLGGYTCHIGVVVLANGLAMSSYYDVDTSVSMRPGEWAMVGDEVSGWALAYDLDEVSPLFDPLTTKEQVIRQRSHLILQRAAQLRHEPDSPSPFTVEAGADEDAKLLSDMSERSARELARSGRPLEYAEVTIRLFPYRYQAMNETVRAQFHARHAAALDEHTKRQGTTQQGALVEAVIELGPVAQVLLKAEEDHALALGLKGVAAGDAHDAAATSSLDEIRALHALVLAAVFERERSMTSDALDATLDSDVSKQATGREMLKTLSWRALGELRRIEASGSRPGAGPHEKRRAEVARQQLLHILEAASSLRPRIEVFYNKRDGTPREGGEVRDPAIRQGVVEDVYLILQDATRHSENPQQRTVVLRVFIKPGMTLGLAGLAILLVGGAFAALPMRKRREGTS